MRSNKMKNSPKRYGINYFPDGIVLCLSGSIGTFYEDYSFQRNIKYLELAIGFIFWRFFVQIPIKKYAAKSEIKAL